MAIRLMRAAGPVACVAALAGACMAGERPLSVYIGGRGGPKGGRIHHCRFDPAGGTLSEPRLVATLAGPTFLAAHPRGRFLYSVNETGRFAGRGGGAVTAFAVGADGTLTELNARPTGGAGPCHLVVSADGRWVLGANYGGGSVFVMPVGADGRLGERTGFVQHAGRSVHPRRQTAPHAHGICLDPAGRFALAADLGLDKVLVYRFDAARGTLTPHEPPFAAAAPGAGPRHLAFHPSGRWVYVINELNSTLTTFAWDPAAGSLKRLEAVSTLPKGFAGTNTTAEVFVHPTGRFVYGSNRGHDSIAVFAVEASTGRARPVGWTPTGGRRPRNFAIDPSGRYLLAANLTDGSVVVFRIDPRTGLLKPTGGRISVPSPACVLFLPAGG